MWSTFADDGSGEILHLKTVSFVGLSRDQTVKNNGWLHIVHVLARWSSLGKPSWGISVCDSIKLWAKVLRVFKTHGRTDKWFYFVETGGNRIKLAYPVANKFFPLIEKLKETKQNLLHVRIQNVPFGSKCLNFGVFGSQACPGLQTRRKMALLC